MDSNLKCRRTNCNEQHRSDSAFCSENCKEQYWGPGYLQKKLTKGWSLEEMQTQLMEWGKNLKNKHFNRISESKQDPLISLAENIFFQHQPV